MCDLEQFSKIRPHIMCVCVCVCACMCMCMYMYVYLNPTTTRLSLLLHDSDVEPRLSINNITYKCSVIIPSVDFG